MEQTHARPKRNVPNRIPAPPRTEIPATHIYGKMVYHMKTTVELPDDFLIAAKKRQPRKEPRSPDPGAEPPARTRPAGAPRAPRPARPIRWVTVSGGLPEGLDVANRAGMHDWLRGHQ